MANSGIRQDDYQSYRRVTMNERNLNNCYKVILSPVNPENIEHTPHSHSS